jgi:hypothetical protein
MRTGSKPRFCLLAAPPRSTKILGQHSPTFTSRGQLFPLGPLFFTFRGLWRRRFPTFAAFFLFASNVIIKITYLSFMSYKYYESYEQICLKIQF